MSSMRYTPCIPQLLGCNFVKRPPAAPSTLYSFHLFASCIPTPSPARLLSAASHSCGDLCFLFTRRKALYMASRLSGARAQTGSSDGKAEWGEMFEWEIKGAREEEVWAVTGDFLGVQKWVPDLIKSCERVEGEAQKPGCVRKSVLYPEPYTNLYEKLLSMDEPRFHYSYSIIPEGTTAPGFSLMRDYVGTFKLSPLPRHRGTLLRWGYACRPVSTMSQEDAHTTVFSLFRAAVAELQPRLSLADDSITLVSKS